LTPAAGEVVRLRIRLLIIPKGDAPEVLSPNGGLVAGHRLDLIDRDVSDDRSNSPAHSRAAWNTVISSGPTGLAPKPLGASRRQKTVLAVIGVTAAARIVGDRQTYERIILLAIVLAAAAGMARAGQVRSMARVIAWDKRQTLAEQRRAGAHRRKGPQRSGLVHTSQVRFSLSPLATLPSVSMLIIPEIFHQAFSVSFHAETMPP
jgi:hypothetical protein